MSTTSSSSHRSDYGMKCACGEYPRVHVSHTPANPGRVFFRCPNSFSSNDCRYFEWEDSMNVANGRGAKYMIFRRVAILKEKIERLNLTVSEELTKLKILENEYNSCRRRMKKIVIALIVVLISFLLTNVF